MPSPKIQISQKFVVDKGLAKQAGVKTPEDIKKGLDSEKEAKKQEIRKSLSVGETLIEAGREHLPCTIIYKTLEGQMEQRDIEPLEVKAHGLKIQLFAHCRLHGETHSFVLDRIYKAEIKSNLKWSSPYKWKSG